MPTNPPTVNALKKMAKLIDERLAVQMDEAVVDEIKAWNRLLKKHNREQGKQPNRYDHHRYKYDPEEKKIRREKKVGGRWLLVTKY